VLDYAERVILPLWFKQNSNDQRPLNALNAAREWLSGVIKLPQAKVAILECHVAARESEGNLIARAAARAIGQLSTSREIFLRCFSRDLPLKNLFPSKLFSQKQNGEIVINNASAQAIYKAQRAFAGVAEDIGVYDEDDVQDLVNEVRYGKDK